MINRARHTKFFLAKVEIKVYNDVIDGQKFFNQPVTNDVRRHENIQGIANGQ